MKIGSTAYNNDTFTGSVVTSGAMHNNLQGASQTLGNLADDRTWTSNFGFAASDWNYSGLSQTRPYPVHTVTHKPGPRP
jgi:hypothetical protein